MRTIQMIGLIGVLAIFAGCGGSGEPTTPEAPPAAGNSPKAAWEAWHAAQVNEDWGGLFELLAPSKRAEAEKAWGEGGELRREAPELAKELGKSVEAVLGMSVRDLYVALNQSDFAKMKAKPEEFAKRYGEFKDARFVREDIDGEGASVKFFIGEREMSLKLVREAGKWYLNRSPLN